MATVLFLLLLWPIRDIATAAEIVVAWTEIHQQVRPHQRTSRVSKTIRLLLQGGNVISESFNATLEGKSASRAIEGQLGNSIKLREKGSNASWSVKDSKSLVRTQDGVQHTSVITVTTQSDNSCSAAISFALKPGFHEYRLPGIPDYTRGYFFRSLTAENVTCRISP